ncbi:MAG: hypothetical protein Fur0016_23780 [Anaerolineales bacterium]
MAAGGERTGGGVSHESDLTLYKLSALMPAKIPLTLPGALSDRLRRETNASGGNKPSARR